jgi:hypothetical protein
MRHTSNWCVSKPCAPTATISHQRLSVAVSPQSLMPLVYAISMPGSRMIRQCKASLVAELAPVTASLPGPCITSNVRTSHDRLQPTQGAFFDGTMRLLSLNTAPVINWAPWVMNCTQRVHRTVIGP